jgi:hypothetical protein
MVIASVAVDKDEYKRRMSKSTEDVINLDQNHFW